MAVSVSWGGAVGGVLTRRALLLGLFNPALVLHSGERNHDPCRLI